MAETVKLSAGQTVGQTFVAKFDGLAGIYFFLSPNPASGSGEIRLHLRSAPQAESDLAVSLNTVGISQVNSAGYYGFYVPPQALSNQKYYYAFLEFIGSGDIYVGKASGDTYLNGALYQDGKPQEAQAAFQLSYSRRKAFLGLGFEALTWVGIIAVGLFLFALPGWGLFSLLWPGWGRFTWPEKLGISAGVSLALYPLLLVWTDVIDLHLGAFYSWLPPLSGLAMVLWHNRQRLNPHSFPRFNLQTLKRVNLLRVLPDIALLIILALIVVTRLWAVRSLEGPQWADSVQHTTIAQLILDNGGLFKSWLPYSPYNSLTIHFGFSAFVALFAWITRLGSDKAALITAQIINILAVLTIYPLAVRIAKGNRWAGIGALLVGGLISPIPAFYVNWGRFAQLSGQAVLPVALWLMWESLEPAANGTLGRQDDRSSRGAAIVFSALALAGMTLCYFRMPFYYAAFVLILLAGWGLRGWPFNRRAWVRKLGIPFGVAILAGLLLTPWALRVSGSTLAIEFQAGVASATPLALVQTEFKYWNSVFFYAPKPLAGVAVAGLVWSLFRKRWMVAAQAIWVMLLASLVAARLIRFPGASMMDTFSIMIVLYVPISLVIGWMVAEIAGTGNGWLRQVFLAIGLISAGLYGAVVVQRFISEPSVYTYVTRPDTHAMVWIREHTPEDSLFLIEGVMYKWHSILGSDAGWWLPLLAGRRNTIPPQYALLNEKPNQADYTTRMITLVESLQTLPLDSSQAISMLCAEGVTHVYVGQLQGWATLKMIGSPQLFSPDVLLHSNYYTLIYHQDRVYVFALNEGVCH